MDYMDYLEYMDPNPYREDDPPQAEMRPSFIRFLHAAPGSPAVDIYLNDRPYRRNIRFGHVTEYASIAPGVYNFKVYPAGSTARPVINANVTIPPNSSHTFAIITTDQRLRILPIRDPVRPRLPGVGNVRFVNLSPDAGNVNLSVRGGRELFRNIGYTQVTGYAALRPGNYTYEISESGTGRLILNAPNQRILPGRFVTLYLVGLMRRTPSLMIVATTDAGTYASPTQQPMS